MVRRYFKSLTNQNSGVPKFTLALLMVGLSVTCLFSSCTQDNQPALQKPKMTNVILTEAQEKVTYVPTIEQHFTLTPTPVSSDVSDEERPELTFTPVIIISEDTPAPEPTPFPTATATPVNPNEKELASIQMPAAIGPISPDGRTMAFTTLELKTEPDINPYNQLWKLDLNSKQFTKLAEIGAKPVWSPDGKRIVFQPLLVDGTDEVKIIDPDGRNERSLLKSADLLAYYWIDAQRVALVKSDGIDQVDERTGQLTREAAVNIPDKDPANFDMKPKVAGRSTDATVIKHDRQLSVRRANGEVINIAGNPEGPNVSDFQLAPNGRQIAYILRNNPVAELWVSDLARQEQRKLFEVEDRHLQLMAWSPNSQAIIIGWSYGGTNLTGGLTPVWIDVKSGEARSLGIDEVNIGLTFSPNGQSIYYGRTNFYQGLPPDAEKSTIYQLVVR